MNVKQLRYFLGVLEAESITKAAKQMNVAQPALGLQIRKLEEELKVDLFIRHSRGVTATEAGLRLASHSQVILRQFERAKQDILDYAGKPQGRVSVGMTPTVSMVLAATVAQRCHEQYPDITLNITSGLSERLMEWVYDDRVDFTLTYNPNAIKELTCEPLVRETLYFAQPRSLKGPWRKTIPLKDVLKQKLILPSRPQLLRLQLDKEAQQIGLETDVVFEIDSVSTIIDLVDNDLGGTVLPFGALKPKVDSGDLDAWPISDPALYRTLHVAQSPAHPSSKAFTAIGELVRGVVEELAENNEIGWELWRDVK